MASIGKFGKKREKKQNADPDTFDWFGSDIRLRDEFNQVRLINLMDTARTVEATSPDATAIIKDLFDLVLEPQDFDTFWRLAEENWQTTDDLVELSTVLMEAITNRPTRRPSDSSVGQPTIPENSPVVSSSPTDSRGSEAEPEKADEPPHRPDLVLLLQQGQETREFLEAQARTAARQAAVG